MSNDFIIDWDDKKIDKYSLDEEFEKQSDLMGKYSKKLADVNDEVRNFKEDLEEKKRELKRLSAEIELDYRTNKKLVEGLKVTEKALESLLNSDPEIISAEKEIYEETKKLNKLLYQQDKLEGMVSALRHKKIGLENLSTLYLSGYFSKPKQPEINKSMRYQQKQKLNHKEK